VGLRAARRRTQRERQAAVVAVDGAVAPRRRRHGAGDPRADRGLAGQRAPRELRRPARRVRELPPPLPRGPPPRGPVRVRDRRGHADLPQLQRAEVRRRPQLQPHVQDVRGPLEDDSAVVWMRPETAQGMFVDFATIQRSSRKKPRSASRRWASRSATRSRPATSSSARASSSRWRWSSSSSRARRGVAPVLDRRALRLVRRPRHPRENLRIREHGDDELSHYAKRTVDVEYYFPMRLAGPSSRASPTAPTSTCPQRGISGKDLSTTTRPRQALHALRHRAGGRRDPCDAGVPDRRLPGRGGADAEGVMQERTVLRLDPRLAPYKVAVLPLSRKDSSSRRPRRSSTSSRPSG
jgi:hypothetical protein